MIKRVFFDLGLTLAETDTPSRYVEQFAKLGCPISLEEAQKAYHLANKYFMREQRGSLGKGDEDVLRLFCREYAWSWTVPKWRKICTG